MKNAKRKPSSRAQVEGTQNVKRIDIEHVAKLANLELTKVEKKKFEKQLTQILDYVKKLSAVDTKNVKPLAHAAGLKNVWREDNQTIPSLTSEEVLSNAKNTHNNFFKVKAIFDDASALAQHHSESTEE